MIVYKCNGSSFYGNKECTNTSEHGLPESWMDIELSVHQNGLENRKLISGGGHLHFCSINCFMSYFFKDLPTFNDLQHYFNIYKKVSNDLDSIFVKRGFNNFIKERFEYCYKDLVDSLKCICEYTNEERERMLENPDKYVYDNSSNKNDALSKQIKK